MSTPTFEQITLHGEDADSFLQGQLTCDVNKLSLHYQATAIANLKGRIEFGIWVKKSEEKQFDIVISSDCLLSLQAHCKKYGAFSKISISSSITIYPCIIDDDGNDKPTFSQSKDRHDVWAWMAQSIASGNFWITQQTKAMFQPQQLRLHQRGGVDYDKGCYLGQEVIARIYFKSAPKAFLQRIRAQGSTPKAGDSIDKIKIVNAIPMDSQQLGFVGFEALVVVSPEHLTQSQLPKLTLLELPADLQRSVGRE